MLFCSGTVESLSIATTIASISCPRCWSRSVLNASISSMSVGIIFSSDATVRTCVTPPKSRIVIARIPASVRNGCRTCMWAIFRSKSL
ncbi:TPA: hypothetical protein HA251_01015 [Candidatus Woesearchaeota archaeon]|nr:hypothetical protein [Candidatus Woesearchaeota archaeon]